MNKEFKERLKETLEKIDKKYLDYNKDEYWLYSSVYEYIDYYAKANQLFNTCIALNLARGLHTRKYRKNSVSKNGVSYKIPYIIHPLLTCRMLSDLQMNVDKETEDIILASALCHDMIEDIEFEKNGKELYEDFYLDKRIYDAVKLVSKRYDFTDEEEKEFFHAIETNPVSLLVKLADRGNNVEDLYNMSFWKIHEYIDETYRWFVPMCDYGLENYNPLYEIIAILRDKIICLTDITGTLVDRYDVTITDLQKDVEKLKEENASLKIALKERWGIEND